MFLSLNEFTSKNQIMSNKYNNLKNVCDILLEYHITLEKEC